MGKKANPKRERTSRATKFQPKCLADWFEPIEGRDGAWTLREGRPDWMQEAVREAHANDAPGDWIYAECRAAFQSIDDGSLTDDDSLHQYADGRVDVYTKELYQWATDHCLGDLYAQAKEESEELLSDTKDPEKIFSAIQYSAIRFIATTILEAYQDQEKAA